MRIIGAKPEAKVAREIAKKQKAEKKAADFLSTGLASSLQRLTDLVEKNSQCVMAMATAQTNGEVSGDFAMLANVLTASSSAIEQCTADMRSLLKEAKSRNNKKRRYVFQVQRDKDDKIQAIIAEQE